MNISDQLIRAAIFFFYMLENVKLLGERAVVLGLRGRGRIRACIPRNPVKILGKYLYVLPAFSMLETFFIGSFFSDKLSVPTGCRELSWLRLTHRRLRPFVIMEPLYFFFYFVICPLLTFKLGLIVTVKIVIPVHIAIIAICATLIMMLPNLPVKSASRRLGLVLEILISPGLIPALSRRMASKVQLDVDALILASRAMSSQSLATLVSTVEYRFSELVGFHETAPDSARKYLAEISRAE